MSQLRRDLEKRIDERLHQWVRDSGDLYDMAGIGACSTQDITNILFLCLTAALIAVEADPNDAGQMLARLMRHHCALEARRAVAEDSEGE